MRPHADDMTRFKIVQTSDGYRSPDGKIHSTVADAALHISGGREYRITTRKPTKIVLNHFPTTSNYNAGELITHDDLKNAGELITHNNDEPITAGELITHDDLKNAGELITHDDTLMPVKLCRDALSKLDADDTLMPVNLCRDALSKLDANSLIRL